MANPVGTDNLSDILGRQQGHPVNDIYLPIIFGSIRPCLAASFNEQCCRVVVETLYSFCQLTTNHNPCL